MKKIIKLSIVLLGAFFVLLGCRSESKAEFALEVSISKQKVTYMYDQEKDSVSSLTFNISYDISKNKEYEEKARRQREKIVKEMDGIEGSKSLNRIVKRKSHLPLMLILKSSNMMMKRVVRKHQCSIVVFIQLW